MNQYLSMNNGTAFQICVAILVQSYVEMLIIKKTSITKKVLLVGSFSQCYSDSLGIKCKQYWKIAYCDLIIALTIIPSVNQYLFMNYGTAFQICVAILMQSYVEMLIIKNDF